MKRMAILCGSLALAVIAAMPTAATTYVVKPDGTGDFPTIQAAIDAAMDGDAIELADGVFTGDGNRDLDLQGKAITVRSLNGLPEECVIDCGSYGGFHRGIYFHNGEDAGSVLSGLTVTNGWTTDESAGGNRGGAILCVSASPRIENCILEEGVSRWGGAICAMENASPTLVGCLIDDNIAYFGAGVWAEDGSSPEFSNCEFVLNWAIQEGGALFFHGVSSPSITDCCFRMNTIKLANGGGAVRCEDGAELTALRCLFYSNGAGLGGAVSTEGSNTSFTECTFLGNSGSSGGGFHCKDGTPEIVSCTFYGNQAVDGGGIYCDVGGNPTIENTILAFGTRGGAVRCNADHGEPLLTCCDIYGNAEGDWVDCIAEQLGSAGNISEDPLFCDPENGDYTLDGCSPCLPGNHPEGVDCGLIGALGQGCGATAVEETSWGRIKALYRR